MLELYENQGQKLLQLSAGLTHERGKWVIFHCVDP